MRWLVRCKVQWLEAHDDVAERIAKAGLAFARSQLTVPAVDCYFREMAQVSALIE